MVQFILLVFGIDLFALYLSFWEKADSFAEFRCILLTLSPSLSLFCSFSHFFRLCRSSQISEGNLNRSCSFHQFFGTWRFGFDLLSKIYCLGRVSTKHNHNIKFHKNNIKILDPFFLLVRLLFVLFSCMEIVGFIVVVVVRLKYICDEIKLIRALRSKRR